MLKFPISVSCAIAAMAVLVGCGQGSNIQTLPNGLRYAKHTNLKGNKPKDGDYMSLHFQMWGTTLDGKDTLLQNTHKIGQPLIIQPNSPALGRISRGLMEMVKGDSVSFYESVDSLYGQMVPPFLKKGSEIRFDMKILDIMDQQGLEAMMKKMKEEQVGKDEEIIKKFLADKGIQNAQRTASGLYYTIDKEGTGPQPKKGDEVQAHYTGCLVPSEKKFDSSLDPGRGEPLKFTCGVGQMIPGFDEGVMLMKQGGKATFYLPSSLAYGQQSPSPDIPANSVLRFEVELVSVKPAPAK
ncbi:MAG: FKBP-type peptidyl-prolyl cis-trans isomerase [Cytophagales bacterium]|nr:FKBP-type peptidyl-prolyl cis-trans isomerase [Bernardetiaceae bacterium]MDW8205286.1 FKBP-type peptidyl-prolyl cis-trans isomerase [Cytophagales bacterium]